MLEPLAAFGNHLPIRIRFGDGEIARLPVILAEEGVQSTVVVIDRAVSEHPAIVKALNDSPGTITTWIKEPGEPTTDDVAASAAVLADVAADALIAIGGGSAMDTAKAARLVYGSGIAYDEWAAGNATYTESPVLFITVPTTSGTGPEVSGGTVVTDSATHQKKGIAHPTVRAKYAIVDPELTYGLPAAPTMYAGIDAIAQAIAAVVASATLTHTTCALRVAGGGHGRRADATHATGLGRALPRARQVPARTVIGWVLECGRRNARRQPATQSTGVNRVRLAPVDSLAPCTPCRAESPARRVLIFSRSTLRLGFALRTCKAVTIHRCLLPLAIEGR